MVESSDVGIVVIVDLMGFVASGIESTSEVLVGKALDRIVQRRGHG